MRILLISRQPSLVSRPETEVVAIGGSHSGKGTVPTIPSAKPTLARVSETDRVLSGELGKFDAIVADCSGGAYFGGPLRRTAKALFEEFLNRRVLRLRDRLGIPLSILDYSDDLTIHPNNRRLLEGTDLYFKRELGIDGWRSLESLHGGTTRVPTIGYRMEASNQALVAKLRPLSIGLGESEEAALQIAGEWGSLKSADKSCDVLIALSAWCRPLREQAFEQIAALSAAGISVASTEKALKYPEYADSIRKARLCLSPAGLGWDCYRHYEAALFGSVPVMSRCDIQPFQPFLHGIDGFYYDPEQPLLNQLQEMLSDKFDLDQMAQRANEKVRCHHLRSERTRYVAAEIASLS